ncbi:hypothetical protein MFUL124B02_10145 [Myxococcus fulvus 124B02]|nr:hypothetical protein MFUL124B02_10145 [Myxococcus fulvus 124B02]
MQPQPDWRPHALDGALLWFHRKTGTNLRVDAPGTRHLRRRAPRLVLFGITNACNLACGFCSREREARSDWTVDSAFEVLSGLSRAGTLEVAFGGGEPLAFRGFDALVERLATHTPLAIHFTTNGVLLSEERLARLRPHLGEVRVSLYEDNDWEASVARLARAGQTFGVNLLATPEQVAGLPERLRRLEALGCRDVALLRYVGRDAALRLGAEDESRLTDIVAGSPVRTRLSVCFGDMLLEVPRLFGGDCGAGRDFVTLTSDRKLKSCSFHGAGLPIGSAEDVLQAWEGNQATLSTPSPLPGCARVSSPRADVLEDGVRVWRGFSGNNSGDCVLVGRFDTPEEATAYLETLVPDWKSGSDYPERWRALLAAEGIPIAADEYAPQVMLAVGRSVLMHTDMTLGDDFRALRTLVWKRKGRLVQTGIHVHSQVMLATVFGVKDAASLPALSRALDTAELGTFVRHANQLHGLVAFWGESGEEDALDTVVNGLSEMAREHGAVLAAELVEMPREANLKQALASRHPRATRTRLWVLFDSAEAAARYARDLEGAVTVAGAHVLLEEGHFGPRLGYLAHRQGGRALLLTSQRVVVTGYFARKNPGAADMVPRLRPYLSADDRLETVSWEKSLMIQVDTQAPGPVMKGFTELEVLLGMPIQVRLHPDNPLAEALHRLREEVEARR